MPNIVTTRFQCLLKSDHQFLAARERIGGPPYPHVRIQSLPSDNQLIACGKNPYLYSFKKKKSRWGRICKPYKPAQESQVNFAQIYLGCSHQIFGRVTKYQLVLPGAALQRRPALGVSAQKSSQPH